ncbi:MAG: HdeD family acid-resistance protein [Pyrinomonadaceae bacterium]|nr:HdeD family acid-resistance protein [Pyrinomonadaceae bacterium]
MMKSIVSIHNPSTPEELQSLKKSWVLFLAVGILFVFLGMFALTRAYLPALTIKATWFFGFLLLAGGVGEIIGAFSAGRWSGTLFHILIGLFYSAAGVLILDQPESSAVNLTLIIAVFMILGGIFKIVFSLIDHFAGWGWVLLDGVITLLIGVMIYKQWPESGTWVIGLFLGIELIFTGWGWVMLSFILRRQKSATE